MAFAREDPCGCFPTGLSYPGIAELLLRAPASAIGVADEFEPGTPLANLPWAVIDTETTGKETMRGDRVVEVGVVLFDRGSVIDRFDVLVDPGIPIPAESSAVHGITDADVRGKPRFESVVATLSAQLVGRVPVAYNAPFDRAFLFSEMRKAGASPTNDRSLPPALRPRVEWIDPLVWARVMQPMAKGFKLGDVCGRLGITQSQAHRAADDAEAAGHVLFALLRERPMTYRETVQRQREYARTMDRVAGPGRRS